MGVDDHYCRNCKEVEDEEDDDDEDYIDMEITSFYSHFISPTATPPPQSNEFEFHMSSYPLKLVDPSILSTTSPADELFFKGKLLPLHLPPRLQIILHDRATASFDEFYDNISSPTSEAAQFQSCSISPPQQAVQSCPVSGELLRHHPAVEYSSDVDLNRNLMVREANNTKSLTKNTNMVKRSFVSAKVKSSSAFLRALFSKSGCSDESSASVASRAGGADDHKHKTRKRSPFSGIPFKFNKRSFAKFSSAYWLGSFSSLSSSSSTNLSSNSSDEVKVCEGRRGNDALEMMESPVQGAIAYCKRSLKRSSLD